MQAVRLSMGTEIGYWVLLAERANLALLSEGSPQSPAESVVENKSYQCVSTLVHRHTCSF